MGIIARFKDIMSSNINALLDKWEDPEKMIDQYLRNLQNDLQTIKSETASVMAEEKASKRKLDECDAEIAKMQEYAVKAVGVTGDEVHALAAGQGHEYAAVTEHGKALGAERAERIGEYNRGDSAVQLKLRAEEPHIC